MLLLWLSFLLQSSHRTHHQSIESPILSRFGEAKATRIHRVKRNQNQNQNQNKQREDSL